MVFVGMITFYTTCDPYACGAKQVSIVISSTDSQVASRGENSFQTTLMNGMLWCLNLLSCQSIILPGSALYVKLSCIPISSYSFICSRFGWYFFSRETWKTSCRLLKFGVELSNRLLVQLLTISQMVANLKF